MTRAWIGLWAASWLAVPVWPAAAPAQGKLDAFEKDANTPAARAHHRNAGGHGRDCLTDALGGLVTDAVEFTLLAGGVGSWERVTAVGPADDGLAPRQLGEPLIPFARLDTSYQDIRSGGDAFDLRAEGGFGPAALQFDFTRYREHAPADRLDLTRLVAAYRMSFGSSIEADLGAGALWLDGEQTSSRFLFACAVLVHPVAWWGVELRPAWADGVSDYDVAALLTWRYTSLKAGYRWVASPHESLAGPYAGLVVQL